MARFEMAGDARALNHKSGPVARPLILLAWLLSLMAPSIQAERLPIRTYTDADGLSSASLDRIVRDSRGFLWFCTRGGLSRFDGARFRTYDERDGLPDRTVNDLLESRGGAYWVATNGGGVCRLDPGPGAIPETSNGNRNNPDAAQFQFKVYPVGDEAISNRVNQLCEDQAGVLWAATDGGVFFLVDPNGQGAFQRLDIGPDVGIAVGPGRQVGMSCILADRRGSVWMGTGAAGIIERRPDGRLEHYSTIQGLPSNQVFTMLEDRTGQLWLGTSNGLCMLADHQDQKGSIVARTYSTGLLGLEQGGPASQAHAKDQPRTDAGYVSALFESSTGHLWIGTHRGLAEFDGERFHGYGLAQGLSGAKVHCVAEDVDGNMWIGTEGAGAMKLTSNGFVSYTQADGPGITRIYNILEDETGAVIAGGDNWRINRFDGMTFVPVRPALPQDAFLRWGSADIFLDHEQCWWLLTDRGLCRFPRVSNVKYLASTLPVVYTTRDGLPTNQINTIYQDAHGDLWIGFGLGGGVIKRDGTTGAIHRFPELTQIASWNGPSAFQEDRWGNLWITFFDGGLARHRNGRFDLFTPADGLPRGGNAGLFQDHAGRLWISSSLGGLARIDEPNADVPRFFNYTTADGLSSNRVSCITEDRFGRIYAGAGSGLDRLDPDTGAIKHFTTADGLANDYVTCAFKDRAGRLWFGTLNGLSRLDPQPDQSLEARPAFINRVRIGGVAYPVSELGQTSIPEMTLEPGQNSIQIEFFAVGFAPGAVLRYQYQLEGSKQGWSEPTEDRVVDYAALAPGTYRFHVRAIYSKGPESAGPAYFTFTILPPMWRRWWFITLAALLVAMGAYAFHISRLGRVVELERVRARIASDLHDDIGASLSQIAVLTGVLRTQLGKGESVASKTISTMYRVSAESLDSMSDIVWAINPQRDHLIDLSRRMRRFASELLPSRGIDLMFAATDDERNTRFGADLRREIYLIFKEAVNNAARHSGCTTVNVEMRWAGANLVMVVEDDGRGLISGETSEGNGLESMRRRAEAIGGRLDLESGNGSGLKVVLTIPHVGSQRIKPLKLQRRAFQNGK